MESRVSHLCASLVYRTIRCRTHVLIHTRSAATSGKAALPLSASYGISSDEMRERCITPSTCRLEHQRSIETSAERRRATLGRETPWKYRIYWLFLGAAAVGGVTAFMAYFFPSKSKEDHSHQTESSKHDANALKPGGVEKIGEACCGSESGKTPLQCMQGPREKLMYVTCVQPSSDSKEENTAKKSDYLATIDIDPKSPRFCQVLHRLYMPEPGDELHHFGWNACVSCKDTPRKYLVVPGLFSGNIHIIDVTTDPMKPTLFKYLKGSTIAEKYDVAYPHTVHCIPSGDVMVHTLGNKKGDAKGAFYLLDGKTFDLKELWNTGNEDIKGHDFWYQPRHNIMISTEFGAPKKFTEGFSMLDVAMGYYGRKIHLWHWDKREMFDTIDLGVEGIIPFEIRFLHNPDAADAYLVTALGSSIVHVSKNAENKWVAKNVHHIPTKMAKGFQYPVIPALVSDCLISLDDKYLFLTCYLHGDVRQYDITDRDHPKLVSQVFLGGPLTTDSEVKVLQDDELKSQPDRPVVKGRPIYGAPHMLQLSRDGTRLYVTTSLLTPWDKQFYPELSEHGGVMVMLDVTPEGMKLNKEFLVDFGKEPDGPCRGHEMRYPGGDCTSDIWN